MSDFYNFPLRDYGDHHDIEQACRVAFQTEHGYGLPEANIERYRVFRDGFYACALRGAECLAIAKGGAVLSSDADNWIKWRGGECPLLPGTLVQIKFSNGDAEIETANNLRWHWEYGGKAGDIVAYRIVQGGAA